MSLRFSDSESVASPEHTGGKQRLPIADPSGLFPSSVKLFEDRDTQEISSGIQIRQSTNEWLDLELLISHVHRWEEQDTPTQFPTRVKSSSEWSRTKLSASARVRPFDPLEVTLGGDVYREDGTDDRTIVLIPGLEFPFDFDFDLDFDRVVAGFFAEGLYRFPLGFTVSASIRGDFSEKANTEWSHSVGATFEIPRTPLTVNGSWSEGFELPSFFALADPSTGHVSANPLESVEVGMRVLFVGDSLDFSNAKGHQDLDDYTKVDITASWQVHEHATLLLAVENLLDANFKEAIGFPDVGIYPRLGVRVRF